MGASVPLRERRVRQVQPHCGQVGLIGVESDVLCNLYVDAVGAQMNIDFLIEHRSHVDRVKIDAQHVL
jgi:hypothetical protein